MVTVEKNRDRVGGWKTVKSDPVVVETITIPSALEGVKIAGKRGSGAECTVRYGKLLNDDVRAYGTYIIEKRLGPSYKR